MEELIKKLQENGFSEEDCEKISQCVKNSNYVPDKYVPIARLNEEIEKKKSLQEQLEKANSSINEIKKSAGDNEELQKKIQQLKDENKKMADDMNLKMENYYKESAIKEELRKVCYDPDYLYTKLNLEGIVHDTQNHRVVAGLKEQLETMKTDEVLKRQFIDNSNSVAGGFNPSQGQQTPPPKPNEVSDAVKLMQGYLNKN